MAASLRANPHTAAESGRERHLLGALAARWSVSFVMMMKDSLLIVQRC